VKHLALVLLAGCAQQELDPGPAATAARPTATPTGSVTPTTPAPEPAAADVYTTPEGARWATLAGRLRAHDTVDLPDRAALLAIPDVAEGLRWIAERDPMLNVRARALDALGVVGSVEAVDHLRLVLADRAAHPKLRAAAAIGLGRVDDGSAEAALVAAVADPDLRVATEAVDQLARRPSALPVLRRVAAEPGVLPEIRAKVDALR
jgi:HEAT repeat protein